MTKTGQRAPRGRRPRRSAALPGFREVGAVTADGVRLAGVYREGLPGAPTFVVAHGFTNGISGRSTQRVLAAFARYGSVLSMNFRGHGGSGGRSSVGRDETLDLDAAVALARATGSGPVAVIGFSMGGAVAVRQGAIGAERGDAVVAVSAPSRWYIRHTAPMRRVHWLLEHPAGPLVGRALGIRLGTPWPEVPPTPVELVGRVPPLPLLVVHGTADRYFGPDQALALHRASGGAGPLWIEPGMGHAESGTSEDLVGRIAEWVLQNTASPSRPDAERGR